MGTLSKHLQVKLTISGNDKTLTVQAISTTDHKEEVIARVQM